MSGEGNNEASGGGLIRGGTVDGKANDQRGDSAGVAEPSTPGREVESHLWCPDCGPETGTHPECDVCGATAGPEVQP